MTASESLFVKNALRAAGVGAVHLAGDEPFEIERDRGESQTEELFENRFPHPFGQETADLFGGDFVPRVKRTRRPRRGAADAASDGDRRENAWRDRARRDGRRPEAPARAPYGGLRPWRSPVRPAGCARPARRRLFRPVGRRRCRRRFRRRGGRGGVRPPFPVRRGDLVSP